MRCRFLQIGIGYAVLLRANVIEESLKDETHLLVNAIRKQWDRVNFTFPALIDEKRGNNSKKEDQTSQFNKEFALIRYGMEDSSNSRNSSTILKDLLCVTFLRPNLNPTIALTSNILHMGQSCDWAIVIYDGDAKAVKSVCRNPHIKKVAIHCRRAPDSVNNRTISIPVTTRKRGKSKADNMNVNMNVTQKLSIPKTVLYRELLPYLKSYKQVLLLDEDISLLGFDLHAFLSIRSCASFDNQTVRKTFT